ncbi:MAG TPA: diacylglycerol kinase [Rubrivivax sp.]|nr:diacylglycerol kinase [Rubrivivax sp.]
MEEGGSAFKSTRGLRRILNAIGFSLAGLRAAIRHEASFRQELVVGIPLLVAVPWLAPGPLEGVLLAGSVLLVWVAELFNSALEALADAVSTQHHPLIGRAKDIGSAAVMLCVVLAGLVWGVLLWPRLGL